MFGHGNKTFSGRTVFPTGLLLDLIDIQAASHKDVVDVLSVELEVVGTSKAQIGDRRARIRVHALSKALQGWPIEGFVVGLAHGGDSAQQAGGSIAAAGGLQEGVRGALQSSLRRAQTRWRTP